MKYAIFYKKQFWIIIITIIILWWYSIFTFFDWKDENYVGQVIRVEPWFFVIDDKKDWEINIVYDDNTKVFSQKNHEAQLIQWMVVFVHTILQNDNMYAKFIKILPDKKENK